MKVLFSWTSILHFSGDFVHLDGTNGAIHRLEQEEEQQGEEEQQQQGEEQQEEEQL